MEPHSKPTVRKARLEVDQRAHKKLSGSLRFPNIANLITQGEITVGMLRPIGCVATANTEDACLAMLVRRRNESLRQLLTRLDQAIAKAFNEDVFTEEINPPLHQTHK